MALSEIRRTFMKIQELQILNLINDIANIRPQSR
jgi:hypothetical protein